MELFSTVFALAQQSSSGSDILGAILALIFIVFWLVVMVLIIAGVWKTFAKAGQPGWASIVPIYNIIVLFQVGGTPLWGLILLLIPVANIVISIMAMINLAKSFGKGTGFALGLVFLPPVFFLMLGFGDATYRGPVSS